MNKLSVTIITLNEENRIRKCLESVSWADEIILVDSFSNDKTLELAKLYTNKIFQREFDNFANQKNIALEKAHCDWVLSLDADEVVNNELRKEILETIALPNSADGYYVRRRNFFLGKELRFGGAGKDKQLRLFRKSKASFRNIVHEEIRIDGKTEILKNHLIHKNANNLDDYFRKLNLYMDLESELIIKRGLNVSFFDIYLKPWIRFFYYFFLKYGFLDGYQGFLFHLLSSYYMKTKYEKARQRVRNL